MTSSRDESGADPLASARAEMAALARQHGQRLYSQARIFVGASQAEDIVQEAFMRFWERQYLAPEPNRSRKPLGLLMQIVHDLAKDGQRRGSRRFALMTDVGATVTRIFSVHTSSPLISSVHRWVRPDEWVERDDVDPMLHEAIETLPERRRIIFHYVHSQDLSYAEVAELLGKSVYYVRSACSVAADHLRRTLHAKGYVPPPGYDWKRLREARETRAGNAALDPAGDDTRATPATQEEP